MDETGINWDETTKDEFGYMHFSGRDYNTL